MSAYAGQSDAQVLAADLCTDLAALGADIRHGAPPKSAAARAVQKALAAV